MGSNNWSGPIGNLNSASGGAVTATSVTDGTPDPSIILPAGLISVGTEMRVRAHGEYTSTSSVPTLTIGVYWAAPGTAIGSAVVIAAASAVALNASATAWPWMLEWDGEFRALTTKAGGATGSVNGMGKLHMPSSLTAFTAPTAFPNTKALRTVSLDTSVNNKIMLGITLSATTGSPSFVVDDMVVELLG